MTQGTHRQATIEEFAQERGTLELSVFGIPGNSASPFVVVNHSTSPYDWVLVISLNTRFMDEHPISLENDTVVEERDSRYWLTQTTVADRVQRTLRERFRLEVNPDNLP